MRGHKKNRGYTLLELLMVVAIVAVIGGGAVVLSLNTEETVALDLVQTEIRTIKEAILQFNKDTGFLPRTGPFASAVSSQGTAWFNAPANFAQLLEEPMDSFGQPIMPWNPDTGRGWRGPYLQMTDGWVDVGSGLDRSGNGSPSQGSLIERVRGVADPFLIQPQGPFFVWHTMNTEGAPTKRRGRPYFLFDWDHPDWRERARLVSSGPNGVYESQGYYSYSHSMDIGDDIVLFLFR